MALSVRGDDRPNILFIFLDDFGWKDTSFMGSDFYETPHLDKLAASGMIFTDAYSAAANCAPARACLLSGQYTPRHEIYNVGTSPRGKEKDRKLEHIPGVDTLRTDIVTWAHCLQKAGYKTATMGKWHLSKDPLPYGFDHNVGGTHSGGPPKGYYPPHGKAPNLQEVPKDEYVTDTLSHRACDFIRENKEHPWMIYLTHFAVHTPIQAKKTLVPKYENKTPGKQHDNVKMATMIQAVDDGVGEIVAELEKQGLRDQTAILFFSDNGGYGPATDMAPLHGYKGTYYEGGIRVPFFVNWPGKVKPGQSNSTPIIGVDLYPTLCAIAGAKTPDAQKLDGKNLLPLFTGKADQDDWAERPLFLALSRLPAELPAKRPAARSSLPLASLFPGPERRLETARVFRGPGIRIVQPERGYRGNKKSRKITSPKTGRTAIDPQGLEKRNRRPCSGAEKLTAQEFCRADASPPGRAPRLPLSARSLSFS